MKWKLFFTALISSALVALPENITGCGPSEDPFDYYTSFFSKAVVPNEELQPFYYSGLVAFNSGSGAEDKNAKLQEAIIREWKQYAGKAVPDDAVVEALYATEGNDIETWLLAVRQQKSGTPANSFLKQLVLQKDATALEYLLLLKASEDLYTTDPWAAQPSPDSVAISRSMEKAAQLYTGTNSNFLKTRFAFLLTKLSFYSKRWTDCTRWAAAVAAGSNNSVVVPLAQHYAAGALYRSGKHHEAAYAFSKLFRSSPIPKEDLFIGFLWSRGELDEKGRAGMLALCRNKEEKANLIAMLAMHGSEYEMQSLEQVYELEPASPLLPLLVSREVAKLEEKYLTPLLYQQKGGKPYYWAWNEKENLSEDKSQLLQLTAFLQKAATAKTPHAALFKTATAYLQFMNRDFKSARATLETVKPLKPSIALQNQVALITLLITANEPTRIDAATEARLLPAVQWLVRQSEKEPEYKIFLRNFLSEVLAQRYEQQDEAHKAALVYGMADKAAEWWNGGIEFVHENMNSAELLKLYESFEAKNKTPYQQLLMEHSTVTRDEVINTIGTSYLREHNFAQAEAWLKKASLLDTFRSEAWDDKLEKTVYRNIDPFYDYVNDYQRYDKASPTPWTKLAFAKKMLQLQNSLASTKDKEALAKTHYQIANGLYNISFYGNMYGAVDYYRHSSSWNTGTFEEPWYREYYGVYAAREHFQKAYALSSNREFKAACYFLVIKCAQRQIPAPGESVVAWKTFYQSPLFPSFQKEFGNTKYYQYVYNRCSYLRDFVSSNKK